MSNQLLLVRVRKLLLVHWNDAAVERFLELRTTTRQLGKKELGELCAMMVDLTGIADRQLLELLKQIERD